MLDDLRSALRVAWTERSITAGINDYQHSKFAQEQAAVHYGGFGGDYDARLDSAAQVRKATEWAAVERGMSPDRKMEDPTVLKQRIDSYWRARLETPLTEQQQRLSLNLQLASQRQHQHSQSEAVDRRQIKLSL